MISQNISKDNINQWDSLPDGYLCFVLKSNEEYLYIGISAKLSTRLKSIWNKAEKDHIYQELISAASTLEYNLMPDSMSALILQKCLIAQHHPQFQQRLRPWQNYVYLALDSHRFPFISIQEHSGDDWLYLGPFRNRFFVTDVIQSISRILKLPFCETGSYPCDKFDKGTCRGWCLALAPARETELEHDLDKLDTLLQESFIHPQNGILELMQNERDAYFNNLEFAKADLLDDEIRLLKAYREWLNFLYVAKDLEFESPQLCIQHGQLVRAELNGKSYRFPADLPEYRANERLALPLAAVDEMKIIYNFIKERANA